MINMEFWGNHHQKICLNEKILTKTVKRKIHYKVPTQLTSYQVLQWVAVQRRRKRVQVAKKLHIKKINSVPIKIPMIKKIEKNSKWNIQALEDIMPINEQ